MSWLFRDPTNHRIKGRVRKLSELGEPGLLVVFFKSYTRIMRAIKSLAINDRIARIKKLKICFNCFHTRHKAKAYSSGSCRQCKEKYYILIHVAKKMQRTVRSIRECLPQISCSAYCNDNTERVMLSIAIVHLLE